VEFRAGSSAIHHTNMLIDSTRTSRRFDEMDPEPGYNGPLAPDAVYPDGHFLGWTPGQAPPLAPEDMCWRLAPASDLVLQMHLRQTGKPEAVQPAVAFFFSRRPATEIPVMLRLGKQDIDIPAGEARYRIRDSFVLPVDAELRAVQPHAHYLAREISGYAELPDGSTRWLVQITDWDFNWQDVYRYAAPFWLPSGTRLVMEYTYDNSTANVRNPNRPPRRVSWGQQTVNEMGDLWIQVLTRNERDRARLSSEVRAKALREDIVGYRVTLREAPRDPALHESLAKTYLQVGNLDEALRHIEESVRLRPDSAAGQYNLGTALAALGRHQDAIARFADAIRLDADFAYAHNSLGVALHAVGRTREAVERFRRAIEIEPAYANAHNNLGKALEVQGRVDEAIVHYREAMRLESDNMLTRQNFAGALALSGKAAEAVAEYRRIVQARPDSHDAAIRLAWILATHRDPGVRNPQQAVQLAEQGVQSGRRDPITLDVLAAAYACAGRFKEATSTAESALNAATAARADELAEQIRRRLALYRKGLPFHEPR
jgi:tetratricopeptide (TPR) repeat protein